MLREESTSTRRGASCSSTTVAPSSTNGAARFHALTLPATCFSDNISLRFQELAEFRQDRETPRVGSLGRAPQRSRRRRCSGASTSPMVSPSTAAPISSSSLRRRGRGSSDSGSRVPRGFTRRSSSSSHGRLNPEGEFWLTVTSPAREGPWRCYLECPLVTIHNP